MDFLKAFTERVKISIKIWPQLMKDLYNIKSTMPTKVRQLGNAFSFIMGKGAPHIFGAQVKFSDDNSELFMKAGERWRVTFEAKEVKHAIAIPSNNTGIFKSKFTGQYFRVYNIITKIPEKEIIFDIEVITTEQVKNAEPLKGGKREQLAAPVLGVWVSGAVIAIAVATTSFFGYLSLKEAKKIVTTPFALIASVVGALFLIPVGIKKARG